MSGARRSTLIAGSVALLAAGLVASPQGPAAAGESWSPATPLSDGARTALGVAVADAAQASPFAAWHESDGNAFHVFGARFEKGRWSPGRRLSKSPVEAGSVRIAANQNEEAIVVWRDARDDAVWGARYGKGTWRPAFQIAESRPAEPRVSMDPNGTATLVWTAEDASGTRRVRAARLPADDPRAAQWVSPPDQDVSRASYVVSNGNGLVQATWIARRDKAAVVEVARFRGGDWRASDTWSNPSRNAGMVRIASSRDGDTAVAWTEEVRGEDVPFVRIMDNGELREAQRVGPGAEQIPHLTVAAGGAERVAVAWTSYDGQTAEVHAALRALSGWSDDVVMPDADSPQVAMSDQGRAALVYRRSSGDVDDIVARFGHEDTWSQPVDIGTTGASYGPRVTVSPGGAATAIWTSPGRSGGPDVTMAARETSELNTSTTPHIDAVVRAMRDMERRTGSDSSEGLLWKKTVGNSLAGAGSPRPDWLVRTQDCWGRTDACSSADAQDHMLATIRSIVANATTTVDVSSLAGVADGGFRKALIAGARQADDEGRRPVVRMLWGRQPAALLPAKRLKDLYRDLKQAAPNLKITLALHTNRLLVNGYSWNHSKIVAADGRVALVGGINMWEDSYLQSKNPVTDLGVVVRGPAAAAPTRFLNVLWSEVCRHPGSSIRYNNLVVPDKGGCPATRDVSAGPAAGDAAVLAVGRAGYSDTGRTTGTRDVKEVSREDRRDSGCIIPPLPNPMNGDASWDGNNPSDTALRALVKSARERVVIGQQEMIFPCAKDPSYDVRLFDAIARKVADGVPVTIVVSNEKASISVLEGYAASAPDTMKVLKRRLVKMLGSEKEATQAACEALTVGRFRYSDQPTWPNGKQPALHSKVVAVDDEAFYVGSQNAYPNQLQEFGYIIEDPAALSDMRRDYLDPLVKYAKPVSCR